MCHELIDIDINNNYIILLSNCESKYLPLFTSRARPRQATVYQDDVIYIYVMKIQLKRKNIFLYFDQCVKRSRLDE